MVELRLFLCFWYCHCTILICVVKFFFFVEMNKGELSKYVLAFKKVNEEFGFNYSQIDISRLSGIDQGVLSRFLNGHNDMASARFFNLIESMPKDFQKKYWIKVGVVSSVWEDEQKINWEAAIDDADKKTIGKILCLVASKCFSN